MPIALVYRRLSIFPVSSTCLLPFVSLETRRIPASSSFISSRLSSLKLTSPKLDLRSFSKSMSVIGPFFSRISTMKSDMGRGLHILFTTRFIGRDPTQCRICYGFGNGLLFCIDVDQFQFGSILRNVGGVVLGEEVDCDEEEGQEILIEKRQATIAWTAPAVVA